MYWALSIGAILIVCSLGILGVVESTARRARAPKGLQWCDNSPKKPVNTIER